MPVAIFPLGFRFGFPGCFEYRATMPGFAPGLYPVKLRAFVGCDPSVDFQDSDTYTLKVLPAKPGSLRVVLTQTPSGDGLVVELRGVADEHGQPLSDVAVSMGREEVTRDSLGLWLVAAGALVGYLLADGRPPTEWAYADWLNFAVATIAWGTGKPQWSPLRGGK